MIAAKLNVNGSRGLMCAAVIPLVLHAAAVRPCRADTVVLPAIADNTMFLNALAPNDPLSSGAGPAIFCGRTNSNADYRQRGLIRFDLTGLPCAARIQSATLTLTVDRGPSSSPPAAIALHRVTAAWGEGSSIAGGGLGVPSMPGDANWIERFNPGNAWSTPGGDFTPGASASKQVSNQPGPVTWASTPGLVADAQMWLATPGENFGWILRGNENVDGTARRFVSREGAATEGPRLTIAFTVCRADFNCDGSPDFFDYLDFVDAFSSQRAVADFNDDGIIDFFDYLDFVDVFSTGC